MISEDRLPAGPFVILDMIATIPPIPVYEISTLACRFSVSSWLADYRHELGSAIRVAAPSTTRTCDK